MKQTSDMDLIQRNMRPGAITRAGLMGPDRRNLAEVLVDDDARVRRLGVTHCAIAARMRELRLAGAKGLGETIAVAPHFEVRVDSVRGRLPCPFIHKGLHQKTNITVRNLRTGAETSYTDLHIHMIEAHGFYEGRGSEFRLDPEALVGVLEVPRTEPD